MNNIDLISKCKDAIINFEKRHAQDHLGGLWGYSFDLLLLKNRSKKILNSSEEDLIVTEMVNRFNRLLKSEDDKKSAFRNCEFAGLFLARYYRFTGQTANQTLYINKLVNAIESTIKDLKSSHKAIGEYERLYNICNDYGLRERAKNYLKQMRKLGSSIHNEMKAFKFEHSESKENLEILSSMLLKGSPAQRIIKIAHAFLPDFNHTESILKQDRNNNPLKYIITQKLLDRRGRVKAVVGPLDVDLEGHVFSAVADNMKIKNGLYLNYIFNKIRLNMDISMTDIVHSLTDSPIVSPDRLKIIEAGLQAYFKNNYLVAIHLLIPQIEEALRNALEINGGVVLNYNEDGSSFVRTLDTILRDDILVEKLGSEICKYFRLVLTDQRGWNLRNDVCHGLFEPEQFNMVVAERLIHVIFCIANIKLIDVA